MPRNDIIMKTNICLLEKKYAPIIAAIHSRSLSEDFLPSLGTPFLTELYKSILELKLGFGFVGKDKKTISGFVLATTDMQKMFKHVFIKKALPLGFKILPSILKNPAKILKIFETFTYSDKESKTSSKAELIVIAVDREFRNQSIGSNLLLTLDAEFVKRGIGEYKVTVISDNLGALNFYKKLGFKFAYNFFLYGKKWSLLIKKL